jgi:hypothetical protein
MRRGDVDIPPFGLLWLDVANRDNPPGAYTVFASCEGSAMVSLSFTAMVSGGLGLDHTIPPPTQIAYGDDVSRGWRQSYRKARQRLALKLRYRFRRVDDRPFSPFMK